MFIVANCIWRNYQMCQIRSGKCCSFLFLFYVSVSSRKNHLYYILTEIVLPIYVLCIFFAQIPIGMHYPIRNNLFLFWENVICLLLIILLWNRIYHNELMFDYAKVEKKYKFWEKNYFQARVVCYWLAQVYRETT